MSYRSIKRILGETSLERKCRFLFGGGLMLLITGSFYFYAQMNLRFINDQNRKNARLLIAPRLLTTHLKPDADYRPMVDEMSTLLGAGTDELSNYSWALLKANPEEADAASRPSDKPGYDALRQLRRGEEEVVIIDRNAGEYRYFGAVHAKESCLNCHYHGQNRAIQPGDLLGVARITFPLDATERDIAKNNAFLIGTAIVTAFLAMMAAYAIVRYVIVKPVLHLQDVSNAIAHGDLDQRADIRTGDEFEELSHAFNRMLRHLVTVQDELRVVNADLDGKVDQLARANLSLHEMNKLKNEFLATMSHELRTPLNSILGFSDVLNSADNLTDKQKRYLRNIETSGKNLLALINDILDLAKIEAGKMDLHPVEFIVEELIERHILAMQPLAERKNIELTYEVDPTIPMARQDVGKLQQILTNLLSNAVKFTPEGGRIRVEAHMLDDRTVEILVADTGIGIPLEDQATIFEKFRQGHSLPGKSDPLTREYEGTGLGLSIVKELTKLLGGEVLLESEFGKGSTFGIRIPLVVEDRHAFDDALEASTVEFHRQAMDAFGLRRAGRDDDARDAG